MGKLDFKNIPQLSKQPNNTVFSAWNVILANKKQQKNIVAEL